MTRKISEILVTKIKQSLPTIKTNINKQLVIIKEQLFKLGDTLPETEEGKNSLIYQFINQFNKQFISTIQDRGVILDTGRNIKDIFVNYRSQISNLNPYVNLQDNKQYIKDAIKNSEGNHMTSLVPPIEVLEQCLKDPIKKPIYDLLKPSYDCCQKIYDELQILISELLQPFLRFPDFANLVRDELTKIVVLYLNKTKEK